MTNYCLDDKYPRSSSTSHWCVLWWFAVPHIITLTLLSVIVYFFLQSPTPRGSRPIFLDESRRVREDKAMKITLDNRMIL